MSCEDKCLGYTLQGFLFLVIGGTWFGVQCIIIPSWLGKSFSGVLVSLIWSGCVALILINYCRACFMDPGRIPASFVRHSIKVRSFC